MKDSLQRLIDRWEAVWDVNGLPSRILLLLFLLVMGGGLTLAAFGGPDSLAATAGVWVAVVVISATAQVYGHRHGGLVLRSDEAPPAEPEANRSGAVWCYPSLLLAVGAGIAAGAGVSALYAAVGALILSYTPLLTYIGFVLRSEERSGEDLTSGDGG